MKKLTITILALALLLSTASIVSAANSITNRLKGKLLLQVQDKGRIWYVDPVGLQKHEVTFSNALSLFQTLALGITNADLIKIPADLDSISSSQDSDGDGYSDRAELQSGFSPYIAGAGVGKFSVDNNLAKKLKGRLLLQVQDKGRIWYIDQNGKRWEVTWGNLMSLFRKLALGITDKDLAGVGNAETANLCKNINQMCRSYSQGVGGGDNCCSGLKCDESGPDGTTGVCKDSTDISTWQTYKNSGYGFEFKYPSEWGEVVLTQRECADSGSLYRGEFTLNKDISFGGNSVDCREGRGAGFLDFSYYTFVDNQVIYNFADKQDTITPSEIINLSNQDKAILIYDQDLGLLISKGRLGALVNLTGDKFPGIAFLYKNIDQREKNILKQLLSTFKFVGLQ